MIETSVLDEHRQRVAAYAAQLSDIAEVQAHGQHALVTACLCAIARQRVADHVDGGRGVEKIAASAGVDAGALGRILRFLEPYGFFEMHEERISLTNKGRLLRSDSAMWSGLALRGANDAAGHLDHSLKTGESAFGRRFGTDFWSFLASNPQDQQAFADAMRLQSSMFSVACVPMMNLSGISTVADIGGGTGDLLASILESNPGVRGILVEQASMLSSAHPALRSGSLAGRCTLQGGDLFGDLPAADGYVLAQVLHNWDDTHVVQILRGVHRAAPAEARLFIVTFLVPLGGGPHPSKTADIGMLALFGGARERTESEMRDLLSSSGWRVESITPTRVAAIVLASKSAS